MAPENLFVQPQIDRELLSPTCPLLLDGPSSSEEMVLRIVPVFDWNSMLDARTFGVG
jgi:hypothetical protein